MLYNAGAATGSLVWPVHMAIGSVTTLDESPPSFTKLQIQDPTAVDDRIVVTFALNEPGTAYCRVTRSDSGETPAAMNHYRVLTASWSAAFTSGTATITMDNLENVVPSLTIRDDDVAQIYQATQYDVYCFARDSAVNTAGYGRYNYMRQEPRRASDAAVAWIQSGANGIRGLPS